MCFCLCHLALGYVNVDLQSVLDSTVNVLGTDSQAVTVYVSDVNFSRVVAVEGYVAAVAFGRLPKHSSWKHIPGD